MSEQEPSTSRDITKMPENAAPIQDPATRQADQIEVLAKEADELRKKLDLERQKLNDIPSETFYSFTSLFISVQQAAERLDPLPNLGIKQRRILKGHAGKVLCMDWSLDKRHIVSSSQVGIFS